MEEGGTVPGRVASEVIHRHAQAQANGTHEAIFKDAQSCGNHGILASKSIPNVEVKRTAEMQFADLWPH
jgi:hypothetical protein